ncbi:MAG: hypothetical protein M1818_003002 [Claussenomyces sp. TS43310]|nr:MAG: hypothetical protein M1818_003002 [Claussenomyces sp. TS43310]
MASFLSTRPGGIPAVGCTLGFGTPFSAQLMSRVGYDYVLVDMEHNPLSASQAGIMTHVVIAASAGKCQPIIRVPSHGVEWIKWALDTGVPGILVPMVASGAEMESIIQSAVYPPRGQRSFGPTLAAFADLDPAATAAKYRTETSKNVAVIPMIESAEGLKNAEAICSVDGVTAVFVGPVDLRFSMGLPGGDGSEDVYLDALQHVRGICRRLGKPVGIFAADAEACRKRTSEGFDFIMLPGEAALLVAGAKANLTECKKGMRAGKL